jgi:hypothetical protein
VSESAHSRLADIYTELAEIHRGLARTTGDECVDQAESPLGSRLHCRLIRSGEIPGYRAGRALLARRRDIDAWLEQHRVQPTEPAVGTEDDDDALLAAAGARKVA